MSADYLAELTSALTQELRLIEDLRLALVRQREGVATDDPEAIDVSVHAIGRTLLTIEQARRRRATLLGVITGSTTVALGDLEAQLGRQLPPALVAAREAMRRGAEATAREVAINQHVLRRALEAGETFLQQLFSSTADPMPVYAPASRPTETRPRLLNRTA